MAWMNLAEDIAEEFAALQPDALADIEWCAAERLERHREHDRAWRKRVRACPEKLEKFRERRRNWFRARRDSGIGIQKVA